MKACVVSVCEEDYKCDDKFQEKLKKKIEKIESSHCEILDIRFSQSTILAGVGKLITRQAALIVYNPNK